MGSESMLQEILWDTKIGWWKVDMARRVLLLSDYLCKTIGTEESEIGYDRFLQSVGEPFRASLKSLMSTYEGENETYIEASAENSGSILYDKEIRDKPRTRRTKRNV